ncbi:MAG: FAD-binding protein, partial [Gemmatimonadales bacterium]
ARVEAASKEIMAACIEVGGTITGEHGVGIDKRGYLPLVCPPPVLRAMGEVRRAFDPEGRCNPGKVLPDGWGPPGPPRAPPAGGQAEEERGTGGRATEDASRAVGGVLEYEPADLVIRMDARGSLSELAEIAARSGQWLPHDPPGGTALTLAEAVASGRSGPLRAGFGRIRDHVLGLTLETHAGERLPLGGRVVKNVAGFDLVRLVVGSGERFGRIVDVTLRLFPIPQADRTLLWEFPGDAEALAFGRRLVSTGVPVAALGWFGGPAGPGGPEAPGGVVAARILGSRAASDFMEEQLIAAAGLGGSGTSRIGPRKLEGTEGAAWWEERAREAGGLTPRLEGTLSLRSAGMPAASGALLEAFRPLVGRGEGRGTGSWLAAHLMDGGVEARIPAGGIPGPGEAGRAPFEEAVRSAGGHLVVQGEARRPDDPVRARILAEIDTVFLGAVPPATAGGSR